MTWTRDKNDVKNSYEKWYLTEEYRTKKSAYDKKRMENPILHEEKKRRHKEMYWRIKMQFFQMYGESCACCGESTKEFLTIEHINGMQGKKRKHGMYQYKEATNEYRPDLYETLCMNCNHAIGRVGYCPHNPNRHVKELKNE